jgi:hypothetical protein
VRRRQRVALECLLNDGYGTEARPSPHKCVPLTCKPHIDLLDESSPEVDLLLRVFQLQIPSRLLSQPNLHAKSLDCCFHHSIRSLRTQKRWRQYPSASNAYVPAVDTIPKVYLLPLPLYTNRAFAKLKIGEYSTAPENCERRVLLYLGIYCGYLPQIQP